MNSFSLINYGKFPRKSTLLIFVSLKIFVIQSCQYQRAIDIGGADAVVFQHIGSTNSTRLFSVCAIILHNSVNSAKLVWKQVLDVKNHSNSPTTISIYL
mgnify:CR=1 FL=1